VRKRNRGKEKKSVVQGRSVKKKTEKSSIYFSVNNEMDYV